MKKLIAVSIFLLLAVVRQTYGVDVQAELAGADISSSDFYAPEASGASANKVAIVDKSGLHYSDPIAAMEDLATWCGVPAASNRCLIRILPGVYNLGINTLYTKPYVDVEGSGENATKIEGRGSGVVQVSVNSELRYLTVEHTGSTGKSIAVRAGQATHTTAKLTNVTIISVKGTGTNFGIRYYVTMLEPFSVSSLVIKNATVIASGGRNSMGIENSIGTINIYRSSINGYTKAIRSFGGEAHVYNSVLNGSIGGGGIITCSHVYDKDYNFYADTCP